MSKTDSNHLIEQIKKEGLSAIENLYLDWRVDFSAFAKKYQASDDQIMDAFQDAMIILFENVRDGKLNELTSSLKTYVFSIGKYTLLNKLKAAGRVVAFEKNDTELIDFQPIVEDDLNEKQSRIAKALENLGDRCRRIILLFYYEKRSIRDIVEETGLKNENTVKAHKSRCMKKLKEQLTAGAT